MKSKKFIKTIILLIMFSSVPAFADLFYWPSEYKAVYDDKVAVEIKYDFMKREYAAVKTSLEVKIRDLGNTINALNFQIAELEKRNADNQQTATARIKDLESQNGILRSKSSLREKELLDENKKLNDRLSSEIMKLRDQLVKEQNDAQSQLADLKADYDKKSDAMITQINEQDGKIANLQKLSDTQKTELNRMSQQANEIEKQLQDEIQKGQIRLKRMQDRIIVNLDDKICFDTG